MKTPIDLDTEVGEANDGTLLMKTRLAQSRGRTGLACAIGIMGMMMAGCGEDQKKRQNPNELQSFENKQPPSLVKLLEIDVSRLPVLRSEGTTKYTNLNLSLPRKFYRFEPKDSYEDETFCKLFEQKLISIKTLPVNLYQIDGNPKYFQGFENRFYGKIDTDSLIQGFQDWEKFEPVDWQAIPEDRIREETYYFYYADFVYQGIDGQSRLNHVPENFKTYDKKPSNEPLKNLRRYDFDNSLYTLYQRIGEPGKLPILEARFGGYGPHNLNAGIVRSAKTHYILDFITSDKISLVMPWSFDVASKPHALGGLKVLVFDPSLKPQDMNTGGEYGYGPLSKQSTCEFTIKLTSTQKKE